MTIWVKKIIKKAEVFTTAPTERVPMVKNFKHSFVDRDDFVKTWGKSETVKEVAEKLGITYGTARTLATKYRKEGYIIPSKRNKE